MDPRASPVVYVSAGEPSGERHAARLVRALKRIRPDASFFGLGGPAMEAEGVRLLAGVDRLAIMGFLEVLRHLPFLWLLKRRIRAEMEARRPALAVFVDYPGYNLNLAAMAKGLGVPVLYYVSPQVWAWKEHRKFKVAARVDRLASILPFESAFYQGTGLRVDYVGHPSVEEAKTDKTREAFFAGHGLDPGRPLLALFPGSRRMEIRHILPAFAGAAGILQAEVPGLQAALSLVEAGEPAWAARLARTHPGIRLVREDRYNLAGHADAVLAKSGTSTIEAAVLGAPMVVVYRGPHLATFLARRFHRLPHISLPNIVAGEAIVPEIIQYQATPRALADAVKPLLDRSNPARARIVEGLARVRAKLGEGSASENVARIAAEMMGWDKP
ncbi:MAG: lipid-A-disaccharide synthase [Planctomycetes bacterium]|jgi:lipid-A-disaccharide synthase|nr:lipid-A-disaccharide synthase [Planctomycetota bacterium]